MAITAITYSVVREDDLKAQGALDGITFEEYQAENGAKKKQELDQEMVTMLARATGIPEANISLMAWDVPFFVESEGPRFTVTDILQIALIVVILALLGFVVFRSMRSEKEAVPEEELSVESLLASTQESSVEDIELDAKSDTRVLIEKFVEENPEAAANLLRNWLQEDWG